MTVAPNWFGVAIPEPGDFDLRSDVYVVIYFHPRPGQAGYSSVDYPDKSGANGTDWKRLFAYVDRLGGQMTGSIRFGSPANRLTVFPFLKNDLYEVPTSEWFNIIHDILQDINTNVVPGICTRPKKVIVATLSNGTLYVDKFLSDAAPLPANNSIIEAWDFDTDIVQGQMAPLNPHGKRLRAYWQAGPAVTNTATKTYIKLPTRTSWVNFPPAPLPERPPLPAVATSPDPMMRVHHYIRDTMFLDAVWNIENDNP